MAAAPAPNYRQIAVQAAQKYGVDPGVFTRQIQQESGFNPAARSGAGAVGIAQFMPATAQSYGIDPTNPVQALDAAARYDSNELKAFGGDYHKALAAYNAGAGNADKWNDPNFAGGQTYRYVRDILGGSTPDAPAAGSSVSPLAAATTRTVSQPQVNESKLLAALSGANSNGGDYSQFYATLKQALHPAAAPAQTSYPQPAAAHAVQPASAGQAGLPFEGASTQGVKQSLLDAVSQAAQAAGASEIRLTSGARSAAHNAQVGGVQGSNHLTGDAVDGYARVGKQWVPLGQLLLKTASRYGLRSGDVPGFFNGGTDPVHVDDGANQAGRR